MQVLDTPPLRPEAADLATAAPGASSPNPGSPADLAGDPPGGEAAERCPNCEAERAGPYCQGCGQHHLEGRITLRLLWRGFAERFLKLERGLMGTFLAVLVRPGVVAREYVQGKRARYLNPLSYLFLGAALTLLLMPLMYGSDGGAMFDDESFAQMTELGAALRGVDMAEMEPARQAYMEDVLEQIMPLYMERLMETMRTLNAVFALVAALILAAFFRLFFGGAPKGYTYAETTVAALFAVAQYYVLIVPFGLLSLLVPNAMWVYTGVGFVLFGAYAVWTALGFYGRSWGTAALALVSYLGTYVTYTVFVMVIGAGIATYGMRGEAREIAHDLAIEHGIHEHVEGEEH